MKSCAVRCSTAFSSFLLWTTASGFTLSSCNNGAASTSGKLWTDTCSNGTMSVSWDIRNYTNTKVSPIIIEYACVNASQTDVTLESKAIILGNIRSSSTTIVQGASEDLICSVSLCHQLSNQFTYLTLGPTACLLGVHRTITADSSTPVVASSNNHSYTMLQVSLETLSPNDGSSITSSMQIADPSAITDALKTTPSDALLTTQYLQEIDLLMSASPTYRGISEPKSDSHLKVALLVGVGIAMSFGIALLAFFAVLACKVSHRVEKRRVKICIEKELRKVIGSPSKADFHIKHNQSSSSVTTDLDNLELAYDASHKQDQKCQTEFLCTTSADVVQFENGFKPPSHSCSSGLPDYQDNSEDMW